MSIGAFRKKKKTLRNLICPGGQIALWALFLQGSDITNLGHQPKSQPAMFSAGKLTSAEYERLFLLFASK